ncbi:MAG: alpha/beta hydrolase [Planctomycetia bacterium]|nr:alpha/beta hydrolase [Planctomycetia bacterium]
MNFQRLGIAIVGWIAVACAAQQSLAVDDPAWPKQTFVYKTVGPTKIEADVYRRNDAETRPAVVWIHGGALIMGNRNSVPKNIAELCRERNYVLISIDYRLAPEVKLPAIIEDLKDAFRWIHTEGPAKFHLDPTKMVVSGGSAGGYLTMMTGICVEPRPKALVAYWGYGDVDGPWYVEPSDFYRKSPLVSKEEAYSVVGREVQTGSDSRPRGAYYLYCRQNGLWTQEVSGFDPKTERQKLDPFCPVRNITPEYPPILMVHGTADTDVPYQESADMDAALKKHGVPHQLITVEGGGHGLGDKTNPAVIDAHARALDFIRSQLD